MLIRKVVNIIFTVLVIIMITTTILGYLAWWSIILPIVLWILITGYGVLYIRSGYFVGSHNNNPKHNTKAIALTFDDGPDQNTLKILELLKKYEVKATFFCIGKQVEQYPEIAKQIIAQGHRIGNHTYTHSQWIDTYSAQKFSEEIKNTDRMIKKTCGKTPLLFRPPYGITNPNIAKAIQTTGHTVIGWNKRSFDTVIPSGKVILRRVTKNLKTGDVILLHDTKNITIIVLEQLLQFLKNNNYTTVTIDELFDIRAYA